MTRQIQLALLLLGVPVAVGSTGCVMVAGHAAIEGSGVVDSAQRSVGRFNAVDVQGSAEVDITVGADTSVNVEADDNILPLVRTEVKSGVLHVSIKESYRSSNPVVITISTPELDRIDLSGSGEIEIRGIAGEAFAAELRGAGDVNAEGRVDSVHASLMGSGDMDFSKLVARRAKATVMGSGDIEVHASESIEAAVRGSGDIVYVGDPPSVSKDISGSGDIHSR